jgi:hypothetical protein
MLEKGKRNKYIVLALIFAVFTASPIFAETLNLTTLPVTIANGYYVGAVGGNINGGTKANYYCDDFATTTYVPSSFTVLISTLDNLSGTKFYGQTDSLKKYQQVGWLMDQMEINPLDGNRVAAIQSAMWLVFNPTNPTLVQYAHNFVESATWLTSSASVVNAGGYNFSHMRIYTPVGTNNQEFVGRVTAVPEPAEWALLIIGLGILTFSAYRNRQKGVVLIRS